MYHRRRQNYQPNIITTSRMEFTVLERKMLIFCINQIDHDLAVPGVNMTFAIPVAELNSNYNEIKQACKTIQSKRIVLYEDGREFDYIIPFPRARYYHNENDKAVLELTLFADSAKYFLELRNQYTQYSLDAMLQIKSLFSQRMYEIFQMHVGRKQYEFEYDVDFLQNMLACNYDEFYDFKRRVLQKSCDDVKGAVGLDVTYKPGRKEGRKTVSVIFNIKTQFIAAMETIAAERSEMREKSFFEVLQISNQRLAAYDFSKWQKEKIIGSAELLQEFLELDSQLRNKTLRNIKDETAYLAKCLGFAASKKTRKSTK